MLAKPLANPTPRCYFDTLRQPLPEAKSPHKSRTDLFQKGELHLAMSACFTAPSHLHHRGIAGHASRTLLAKHASSSRKTKAQGSKYHLHSATPHSTTRVFTFQTHKHHPPERKLTNQSIAFPILGACKTPPVGEIGGKPFKKRERPCLRRLSENPHGRRPQLPSALAQPAAPVRRSSWRREGGSRIQFH